jgi:2,3-dihydro-2,3-dihydroxybenzoate dehydrogenase
MHRGRGGGPLQPPSAFLGSGDAVDDIARARSGRVREPRQRHLAALPRDADAAPTLGGDPSKYRVGIPLGKFVQPSDIANAVLFLVSDQAGHMTMHDLYVDGGATLRV